MRFPKLPVAFLLVVLFALSIINPLFGQNETIITVALPPWMSEMFNDDLFEPFHAEHPGVKVITVNSGDNVAYNPAFSLDEHLDAVEAYAQMGDVLYISGYNLSPHATAAGYFLNLMPLIESDPNLNPDDFYPAVWQSYQWDRGVWAMPVSASVEVLIYSVDAFDEAGLSYPNENWTLDDLFDAAVALTQYDDEGNITVPGFAYFNPDRLFVSLTGGTFYDATTLPNEPSFDHPELVPFVERWIQFQQDIVAVGSGPIDFNAIPITLSQTWRLSQNGFDADDTEWAGSLLPGGRAGLTVQGFAVSGGTANPELAYALTEFLTRSPETINFLFGDVPARRSMVDVEPEEQVIFGPQVSPEARELIDRALENAIPASELRFSDYLNTLPGRVVEGSMDVQTALEEVEAEAVAALETARERANTTALVVATPVPTPVIGQDQIVLKFGANLFTSDSLNDQRWDQLIADFTASYPRVGNIDIVTQFFTTDVWESMDCFFDPFNNVSNPGFDTDDLLNLDPFIDADPNFDESDFLPNAIQQVSRDGSTWAYPIILQPEIMWYNTELFEQAGVPEPVGGWTVEAFEDALIRLESSLDTTTPPFAPQSFNPTYLYLLMAAYGGIPYDQSTDPATLNLTDPDTMIAVQEVLDLARDGYMRYQELSMFGGGGGSFGDEAITTETFSSYNWRFQNRNNPDFPMPYEVTTYPSGSRYTPIAYTLGSAYIRTNAQDPEACYRWITMLAEHPDLLGGMPARLSQLNDPNIAMVQGEDVDALYQEIVSLLNEPNALVMPGQFGSSSSSFGAWIEPTWIYQAFNDYVLNDVDFQTAMEQAQRDIETYRECTGAIEEVDTSQFVDNPDAWLPYMRQFTDCAISITPDLRDDMSFYYEEPS